jgi:hypothetical protein
MTGRILVKADIRNLEADGWRWWVMGDTLSPDAQRQTAERDERAMRLHAAGVPFRDISDILGMAGAPDAVVAVRRGIAALPRETAEEHVHLSGIRHDHVTRYLMGVLSSFHPMVNNGKVMQNPLTGELVDDPMPKLAAAKLLIQVDERRARLLGLDQPKTTIAISIDDTEREIRKLESELAANTGTTVNSDGAFADTMRKPWTPLAIEQAKDADRGPGLR